MTSQARADFLESRRSGIGGSDISAIMGISRYKTAYQVWAEKTGLIASQPDNPAMLWGRLLEPVVLQHYADVTGRNVSQCEMLRHPQYPFMVANLDGFTDDKRVVEIKTARMANAWGVEGSDQVPQEYFLQVQWYMAVTGFEVADIAVLIGASDYRQYEINSDPELQLMMIEEAARFWQSVQDGTPPETTSIDDARLKWPQAHANTIMASIDIEQATERLHGLTSQIDRLQAEADAEKGLVMSYMGDYDTLATPNGAVLATWKNRKGSERLDGKALKAAHPDIYKAFAKTGESSRTFSLK